MRRSLSARDRRRLEVALSKYDVDDDEPLTRIHPHLQKDQRVARKEDWLGRPGRPGILGWKSTWTPGKATWNPDVLLATAEAFKLASRGPRAKLVEAVERLEELPGVGARVGTAILTFYDPDRFTVMDVNAWRSLVHLKRVDAFEFGYENAEDYPGYNAACKRLKREFRHTLRETDRALWVLGASKGHPETYPGS